MIRVMFVCHGNICRSTMAESVLTHMVNKKGIGNEFIINSSATSTEEIGNPVHYGTEEKLREKNIPCIPHRAIQLKKEDYDNYDYFIGMDSANIRNMKRILGKDDKIYKLLYFSGETADVRDPWYTGNFEETYNDVIRGCNSFLEFLNK